ncbi:MAG: hypothetical protein JWO55_740 [Candidatus Saccharibacteria bacterium]|jgi:hypothetical protein|nr:hypothetical protein [Candidatus Saccharibacteria bacterium]
MDSDKRTDGTNDISLHSSGYAEAAKKSQMNVFSPQSFNQRLHIERNRQSVGRYHDSMLANGHHRNLHYQRANLEALPIRPEVNSTQRPDVEDRFSRRSVGGLISDVVKPANRPNFIEPSVRGYNPYK